MKYLLTIYVNAEGLDARADAAHLAELDAAHTDVQAELKASGEFIEINELSYEDARSVRVKDGRPLVTEGPFTEGHDITGGFYLVDVASMDRAIEIAGRFVEARFAPVEVRRIVA